MAEYDITTDTGLSLTLESDGELTQEDVESFLKNRQKEALIRLAAGPGFKDQQAASTYAPYAPMGGLVQPVREDAKGYYSKYIPAALNIPEDKFNYSKSLPFKYRERMDFLQDQSSRAAYLRKIYGDDNVTSLNLKGSPTLLYRDPKADEWRLTDSMEFELADFTADIAGDIFPIGAGMVAGMAALVGASPSAVPTAGTGPVIAASAAAAAAEAAAGSAQDIIAKKALGLDIDLGEIRDRRSKEMAINFTIDLVTMKTGRIFNAILGKEGVDVASKELAKTAEVLNRRMPTTMLQGEEGIKRAQDIASKFPESTAANFMEDVRDAAGQRIVNEFGVEEMSEEGANKILREGMDNMTRQAQDDISKINSSLQGLAESKSALSKQTEAGITAKAKKEAREAFDAELQRKAKNVTTKGEVSPEKVGLDFQGRMANKYVEVEAASRNAFEDAYFQMQNVRTSADRLSGVFDRTKNKAILDSEDEVIAVLAPGGRTASGRAVNSLEDISGDAIGFKQLNELIQLIEEKTKRGAATPGFNAGAYRKLANDLRTERESLLKRATPEARSSFNKANRNFRETVLPFRESDIFRSIRPEMGQNYQKAISDAASGQKVVLPKLSSGGTEVISTALRNPKNIKDFLRSSGNTLESRKLLRDAWLSSKGLVGGQPIPRSALKFSPEDLDIARTLWPAVGEAGFNRKVETLRKIARFSDQKDDFIDGVTVDTFNRIMNEGFSEAQTELTKIGSKEVAQKKALDEITKSKLVKLMGQGKVPLPTNSVTMESFADGILKSDVGDVVTLMKRMEKESPELVGSFRMAVYQALARKAGRGTDAAQVGKAGFQLWNPEAMSKQLTNNENQLIAILGENAYKNTKAMNDGIRRFSVRKGVDPEGNIGAATSGRGLSLFLSNLGGAVKDRFAKHILAAQVSSPIPFKKIVSVDQYENFMGRIVSSLFLGSNSTRALIDDADADPEFRKKMTEMYSEVLTETE